MNKGLVKYTLKFDPLVAPLRQRQCGVYVQDERHPYMTVRDVGRLFGIHDMSNYTDLVLKHFHHIDGLDEFAANLKGVEAALREGLGSLPLSDALIKTGMTAIHAQLKAQLNTPTWVNEAFECALECYIKSEEFAERREEAFRMDYVFKRDVLEQELLSIKK